jgi:UDP-N-acetylmuramoylalanine--D-glutamate ligase
MTTPHSYPAGSAFRSTADIKGKKITVMGLGLNGGGEAAVRFFLRYGAFVTATDMKTPEELAPTVNALEVDPEVDKSRFRLVLGRHDVSDFTNADVVIKNPGIKYDGNEYLSSARAIETDISVFLALTKAPIIAVTGSKGKSTTVSAIHYGLCKAGFTAFLGGNITVSPLTFLEQTTGETPVVLELSSWQLADLRGRGVLKPKIALITTIVPDHQNWYDGMEPYIADKKLVYADQSPDDWSICGNDEWGDVFARETRARVVRYAARETSQRAGICTDSIPIGDLLVPGKHARQNVQNAARVLTLMGVNPADCARIFADWPGIPHRLEYFHTWTHQNADGTCTAIKFYNDSAATVPEAAAAASQAFGKPVHFVCGGTDKQLDFTPLADTLACKLPNAVPVASLYLLAGSGTDKFTPLLEDHAIAYNGPYPSLETLLASLKADLQGAAGTEEIVVFSPGTTSFGMFKNEFDRGEKWKAGVTAVFP